MSWQAYVDTNLVGSGTIDKAAIIGHDGSVWAKSSNFQVGDAEAQSFASTFSNSADLLAHGVKLEGKKYVTLKADDRSVYLKQGKSGACCVRTTLAILIAHYNEAMQPGAAATTVEKLADYMISVNF